VLKVQKSYYNKIWRIIIDLPYNTRAVSKPDTLKENSRLRKRIGDKNEEGYLMKEGMFRKIVKTAAISLQLAKHDVPCCFWQKILKLMG
jgi:adenine-specific DNA-methyltransferase